MNLTSLLREYKIQHEISNTRITIDTSKKTTLKISDVIASSLLLIIIALAFWQAEIIIADIEKR